MMWWRRAPTCRGTTADGPPCTHRVDRAGDRCTACLEVLATSSDRHTRRKLAGQSDLAPHLFQALAGDEDRRIRLAIARRSDCPLVVLQRLEHDEDAAIRAAAGTGLSAALAPRALDASEAGGLFTEAELVALADSPREAVPVPEEGDATAEPRPTAAGTNEVLRRLDAISQRLTVLEARLATEPGWLPPPATWTRSAASAEEDASQPRLPGVWEHMGTRRPEGVRGRRLHSRRP